MLLMALLLRFMAIRRASSGSGSRFKILSMFNITKQSSFEPSSIILTICLIQRCSFLPKLLKITLILSSRSRGCPSGSTSFNILITQGSTPYSVTGISTYFKNNVGANVNVYWAGGGVKPIVTNVANKTDIYSFKTYDGGTSWYGVVGGQNFAL